MPAHLPATRAGGQADLCGRLQRVPDTVHSERSSCRGPRVRARDGLSVKDWLVDAKKRNTPRPKCVIERELPGAGNLSDGEIKGISQKSNEFIVGLPGVVWQQSYVTDNKIFCVYIAPDEAVVREHAERGGFPANSICSVRRVIHPSSAG